MRHDRDNRWPLLSVVMSKSLLLSGLVSKLGNLFAGVVDFVTRIFTADNWKMDRLEF